MTGHSVSPSPEGLHCVLGVSSLTPELRNGDLSIDSSLFLLLTFRGRRWGSRVTYSPPPSWVLFLCLPLLPHLWDEAWLDTLDNVCGCPFIIGGVKRPSQVETCSLWRQPDSPRLSHSCRWRGSQRDEGHGGGGESTRDLSKFQSRESAIEI